MRIAVIDLWHNYTLTYSWSIAHILSEKHEVVYVGNEAFKERADKFKVKSLQISWPEKTSISTYLKMPLSIMQALEARKALEKFEFDFLIFAFDHPLLSFLKPKGVKCIATVHELDQRQGFTSFLNNLVFNYNSRFCDAFIVMNDSYKEVLERKKLKTIRIEHPLFVVDETKKIKIKDKKLKLLFLGKIRPDKGLDVLLKACLKLDKSVFDLTVAGSGDLQPYKNLISDLGKNIKCINKTLTDEEITETLAQADLVVLPYKSASQSGVGNLCVSYKIPMLVSDFDILSRLVDYNSSFTFEVNNDDQLRDKINSILSNKELLAEISYESKFLECRESIESRFNETLGQMKKKV